MTQNQLQNIYIHIYMKFKKSLIDHEVYRLSQNYSTHQSLLTIRLTELK